MTCAPYLLYPVRPPDRLCPVAAVCALDNLERSICFGEQRYSTIGKEALSLVLTARYFRNH